MTDFLGSSASGSTAPTSGMFQCGNGACPDTTTYHIGGLYPTTGTPGQRVGIAVALADAIPKAFGT